MPKSLKVLTIVGARPQFIKAAPVSKALAEAGIAEFLLHTGQHYDQEMSGVFFEELGLRQPDLNLQAGSGSHAEQTGAMMVGIERAILQEKPDWVLIYGDTNSTLAGVLAASKIHVPVAHVEAGLRSFNRRMPEEINRLVADALATLLFVPTETARYNLQREGVPDASIVFTGDVMQDATLFFRSPALARSNVLSRLGLRDKEYVLATLHRAENTDVPERLRAAMEGLALVAREKPVVLPLHPRTRKVIQSMAGLDTGQIKFLEPLGYLDMTRLEAGACVIATDSGGVQKEAFFHQVPCVTLRDETEWVELVAGGWNRLCPPVSPARIAETIRAARWPSGGDLAIFGDGHAAVIIATALRSGPVPAP